MNKDRFTQISEIGEHGLINKITNNIKLHHKSTKRGVGDDAAVISSSEDNNQLISTDMLVEGIHFNPNYCPMKHLGYKAMVVNISDICAMNGHATHALASIAIPNKYSVELIEQLYSGINLACNNYNIDLIGGDTTASSSGLVINVTIIGESLVNKTTYRSGAKPGDLLVASGTMGGAYLGLQILERENNIFKDTKHSQPNLENYSFILEKQLKPEARVDIINYLDKLKITPSSMIDMSDGLASESRHLIEKSEVGIKIFENKLSFADETKRVARELNIDTTTCALYGGEDYELLFTISQKDYSKIANSPKLNTIGHVTKNKDNLELVTENNDIINLNNQGWDSFLTQFHKK